VQAINLKGPFLVMKHGIPHLIRSGGGSIINVGSSPALAGFTVAQDSYTAARRAHLAHQVDRHQLAARTCAATIIHPGIIETPMQAPYLKDPPSGSRSRTGSRSAVSLTRARSRTWRCSSPRTSRRT